MKFKNAIRISFLLTLTRFNVESKSARKTLVDMVAVDIFDVDLEQDFRH